MDELAAVDGSVRASIGIEELLQSIASPHVLSGVIADALYLRGCEWFARGNVLDDPRFAGCVVVDQCALGSRERRFAYIAIDHDTGVRVVRSGHAREEVAEAPLQTGHH